MPALQTETKVVREFTTQYKKLGKHRKECHACKKLLADGETVKAVQTESKKFYPVKGLMAFFTWHFYHVSCYSK